MLSPQNQELVLTLLRQLAERENIHPSYETALGLQTPEQGFGLWEASLIGQGYSKGTIQMYTLLVKRYLVNDPVHSCHWVIRSLMLPSALWA